MDWNYYDTFIAASEDSPARAGTEPLEREGAPTVAFAQHRMIARHPYGFTQEDVLFETSPKVRGRAGLSPDDGAALLADFLSKPTASGFCGAADRWCNSRRGTGADAGHDARVPHLSRRRVARRTCEPAWIVHRRLRQSRALAVRPLALAPD